MADMLQIQFAPLSAAPVGTLVLLAGDRSWRSAAPPAASTSAARAPVEGRRGRRFHRQGQDDHRDPGSPGTRHRSGCILLGTGKAARSWTACCSAARAFAQISARKGEAASIVADPADPGEASAEVFAADLAYGALLRSYTFKKYRTKKPPEDGAEEEATRGPAQARHPVRQAGRRRQGCSQARKALAEGIVPRPRSRQRAGQHAGPRRVRRAHARPRASRPRGRDPRRGPARRARRWARCWPSGRAASAPRAWSSCSGTAPSPSAPRRCASSARAWCFDTGGISIKPAAGMEDMKGDMGGAACVAGLMLALAKRKAAVNAVGLHRPHREHAVRHGAAPRRHRHQHVRPDHRGAQHRRRRPPRAGRRALVRAGALQAAFHRRPRHADRRHHGRARQGVRRPVRQRRPARRRAVRAQARRPARRSGACRSPRPTTR